MCVSVARMLVGSIVPPWGVGGSEHSKSCAAQTLATIISPTIRGLPIHRTPCVKNPQGYSFDMGGWQFLNAVRKYLYSHSLLSESDSNE